MFTLFMMQELGRAGLYVYLVNDAEIGPGGSTVFMFTLFMMQELEPAGLYVYLVHDARIGPSCYICLRCL